MAWYWWVLIAAVLVVGGYIKVKILTRMMRRNEGNTDQEEM